MDANFNLAFDYNHYNLTFLHYLCHILPCSSQDASCSEDIL